MIKLKPVNFLLVEDDDFFLYHFDNILKKSPFVNIANFYTATTLNSFNEVISSKQIDICITDLTLFNDKVGGDIAKICKYKGITSALYSNYEKDDEEISMYNKDNIIFYNKTDVSVDVVFLNLLKIFIKKMLQSNSEMRFIEVIDPIFDLYQTNKFLRKNINLVGFNQIEKEQIDNILSLYFKNYYLGNGTIKKEDPSIIHFLNFDSKEVMENFYNQNETLTLEYKRSMSLMRN